MCHVHVHVRERVRGQASVPRTCIRLAVVLELKGVVLKRDEHVARRRRVRERPRRRLAHTRRAGEQLRPLKHIRVLVHEQRARRQLKSRASSSSDAEHLLDRNLMLMRTSTPDQRDRWDSLLAECRKSSSST